MNQENEQKIDRIAKNICAESKVFDDSGYSFSFYSIDIQEPIHIHAKKDRNTAKFWVQDETYGKRDIADWSHACKLEHSDGYKQHELNQIAEIIEKRKDEIVEKWKATLDSQNPNARMKESSVNTPDEVRVEAVMEKGFDLIINGEKIFVSFDKLPIFKEVQIQDIFDVRFFGIEALEWRYADIHIPIDALIHPEKYIWKYPAKHIEHESI